jgi:hypothetical protein
MTKMPTAKMREYQRERRARIKDEGDVNTIAGVMRLVRRLESRVGEIEMWVREVERESGRTP